MEEMACDLEIGSFEKGKIFESVKTCLGKPKRRPKQFQNA